MQYIFVSYIFFFYKELGLGFLTENYESYFKVGNIDRSIIKITKKREKKKRKWRCSIVILLIIFGLSHVALSSLASTWLASRVNFIHFVDFVETTLGKFRPVEALRILSNGKNQFIFYLLFCVLFGSAVLSIIPSGLRHQNNL